MATTVGATLRATSSTSGLQCSSEHTFERMRTRLQIVPLRCYLLPRLATKLSPFSRPPLSARVSQLTSRPRDCDHRYWRGGRFGMSTGNSPDDISEGSDDESTPGVGRQSRGGSTSASASYPVKQPQFFQQRRPSFEPRAKRPALMDPHHSDRDHHGDGWHQRDGGCVTHLLCLSRAWAALLCQNQAVD